MEQCSSLHLVVPYFGYSTMERKVKEGEVVTAKNIARMLSSVPLSPRGNYLYMVDIHSLGVQYYFEGSMHAVSLTAQPLIKQILSGLGSNPVLASADMGRAKWVERMSKAMGLESAYLMKKRLSDTETEVIALNADVRGKTVAIYDDMIRSGTSIINAAKAYKNIGAAEVYVITTHGVFAGDAASRLQNCGAIKKIFCTNTHHNTSLLNNSFIEVIDISPVLLEGLEII